MNGGSADFIAVSESLFALKPRGRKLGIDRMRPLASALGHPETAVPCVHIAGTNGKGSVAAMLEAILRWAGWRVGLFTSPHLVHLGERIQVNRVPLTETRIITYARQLQAAVSGYLADAEAEDRPSFFELMTAMAFLEFRRTRCDISVLEVGLGGEFDATNIVMPEVSVITSIGIDHCEWLGHTIEAIARAKAGIIKAGIPVVLGRVPPAAEAVVREIAAAQSAPVISVRTEFGDALKDYPMTSLAGDYQRWNAATAVLAARTLGARWKLDGAVITSALTQVEWAGRWQRTRVGGRTVILDASHNPEGAAVLDRNLADLARETGRRPVVITGVLGIERAGPLVTTICDHARTIYFVVPAQPRAISHAELESRVPPSFSGTIHRSTVPELFPGGDVCTAGATDDVIVVTGSIYLLGEVMTQLASRSSPESLGTSAVG